MSNRNQPQQETMMDRWLMKDVLFEFSEKLAAVLAHPAFAPGSPGCVWDAAEFAVEACSPRVGFVWRKRGRTDGLKIVQVTSAAMAREVEDAIEFYRGR